MLSVLTVSPRTKQAAQDYAALNTITTAAEHMRDGTASEFDLRVIAAMNECDDRVRIRLNTPLGRRMQAAGLIARSVNGRGRVRNVPR